MKFYLAGPVGYGKDGTKWKDNIKKILRAKRHEVYDPIENDEKYEDVEEMNKMKDNPRKYHKEIKKIMAEIFIDDCKYITECDYIICYFSGKALGTASEQGIAYYLNLFSGKNVKTISIFSEGFHPDEWTICCSNHIFFSTKECITFLRSLQ